MAILCCQRMVRDGACKGVEADLIADVPDLDHLVARNAHHLPTAAVDYQMGNRRCMPLCPNNDRGANHIVR